MSTLKSLPKKRKRDSTEGTLFKLSASALDAFGPALVSYPALDLQAPPSVPFQYYESKKSTIEGKEGQKRNKIEGTDQHSVLIVGETADMEFASNQVESQKAAQAGCRYLVAVHNRRTSTLNILPAPKSPHILGCTVKALKSTPSSAPTLLQYRDAKNALGESFGTKKIKANIRAQERNHVDVGAMEGVIHHLQYGIDKGAAGLMSHDETQGSANNNRLIPTFNATAADPADVYPLHNIIPEVEWKALSVGAFQEAASDAERIALLPFKTSQWTNLHVNDAQDKSSKIRKRNLKISLYISIMLAFRRVIHKKSMGSDHIVEKLPGVPAIIVDGLLAKFTEVPRGSSKRVSTSATETNLLTHMFALCLRLDSFATDTSLLARDLSMPVMQVNQLFKALGCKMTTLKERDRSRLGLPDSAAPTKRAVLNAPVVFPKPKTTNRNNKGRS